MVAGAPRFARGLVAAVGEDAKAERLDQLSD